MPLRTSNRTIHRWLLSVLLLFALNLTSADVNRDPKAVEITHSMMQAMGGEEAWNSTHFVRFDFKVIAGGKILQDNAHLWDKKDGRYRIERMDKGAKHEVILFSIGDYERNKDGSAYINGKKLEGEAAKKAVEDAYASYINDTWWLSMPWKWLNPGVNLKYLGLKTRGHETDDVVELTFNHVGLTPGDMYHAYVSNQSHLMTHWEYVLQSGEKGSWDWQYGDFKGVKLARNHVSTDHKTSINMGNVHVLDQVDDAFFTDPAHMLEGLKQ
jgi:hypothetical protein